MNEPEWLQRLHIIGELESFLDTCGQASDPKYRGSSLNILFAEGLLLLLREQHERDPDVPPDAR